MCGITGIFAFNSIGRINLVHLEAATRCLSKRGPDAHNSWFDEIVGIGHRRLSIIDTSTAANQPMFDETARYGIVFNGEIYNYLSIRQELLDKGFSFQTESDTEVLLKAYIHWGANMLNKLNGFFAFAIYDKQEGSMLIARDRFGIKPLLYAFDEDRLLFASEMKSLMTYGMDRSINKAALNLYFQLTYIPAPHTIFEGVHKLEPGHYLEIKNREVSKHRYYDFPDHTSPTISDLSSAKESIIDTLRASVQDRLVSDVPLGAFLSGGIDSSIITALASEKVDQLKTFSIGFKDNKFFDETHYANLVAEKYQTDHQVFSLTNDDLLSHVSDVVDYIDEPFADSSALPVFILSQQTRKHVTVALSGDGADEIFSGYNKHSAWLMSQQQSGRNSVIKTLGSIWSMLPHSRNNKITNTFRQLDRFAQLQGLSLPERYWFLASFIQKTSINPLLKSGYQCDTSGIEKEYTSLISSGHINEVLSSDVQMVLQGDMLQKVDLMSMANGLEVRVPFLDHRVVSLAFQMEQDLKIRGNQRKIVLREAFREYLPEELYSRPKHGFEVPLLDWFRNELSSELDQFVFNQQLIDSQGIFEWKQIARIKKKLHSIDPGDSAILVWSLFVFNKWYQQYLA
ncbi:MAG: asparagine synthase (glutamine-hydrolyzing) [Flammeovirgaceae bacterium]|nr:asparagine synthase (glutamine-hydrolyzing) [Flammeovirgaceae bacterium]MBR07082.1 asparagine synthase (glutamine-hydrolyzing) [Rickettsiales bacterium]